LQEDDQRSRAAEVFVFVTELMKKRTGTGTFSGARQALVCFSDSGQAVSELAGT
jgi:hypothetical protein